MPANPIAEHSFYPGGMTTPTQRMATHEAANLVRTWASTGQLPPEDIARALAELERLLVERTRAVWLLGRLAEAWPELRDGLGELIKVYDG